MADDPGRGKWQLGTRAEWLHIFEAWFGARFRAEFSDVQWTYYVNDGAARVSVSPKDAETPKVVLALPADFMEKAPFEVASQAVVDLRIKAETDGFVPRRRTAADSKA